MAQSFGLTWWGQRWLDSLTHIDFANRIPRGARLSGHVGPTNPGCFHQITPPLLCHQSPLRI